MMLVSNKKLEEFPDKDKYLKKEYDMQYLTTIDNKVNKSYELSLEELKFLYEIDEKIEGFGYEKELRIIEIRNKRNVKQDFAKIFNCKEEDIYIGDIEEYNIYKLKNKKVVVGNLKLSGLISAEGLALPQSVYGYLKLSDLRSTEGLVLPQNVKFLDLSSLKSAKGLVLPQSNIEFLNLRGLISAEGLVLPQSVTYLDLSGLISAKGLVLPQNIEFLNLSSLTSVKGLVLPQSNIEFLNLSSLTNAEGLALPQSVKFLYLNGLTSTEGLVLPQRVDGYLNLSSLISAKGLKLPIGLDLNHLIVSEEVKAEIKANSKLYYQAEETVKETE